MVLMINRSSVTFICNRLYIYLHSYEIRLTSKHYIWTKKFAFVYRVINSCTFQNKQVRKKSFLSSKQTLTLFFLNIFTLMVKFQFFLKVGKNVVATIILPPTPPSHFWLRPCHLSVLLLCKKLNISINLAEVHNNIFECNKISPDEMMELTKLEL